MSSYKLRVFDYNYSSWSMRAGVVMRLSGVPFEEVRSNLDANGKATAQDVSPSSLLPLLEHGALKVWDSLAIAEYMAEQCPDQALWPRAQSARAAARSASAEMHSGFSNMRQLMSMNIRARYPHFPRPPAVERDVSRIKALWTSLRAEHGQGGAFLCGAFGIVDAMFAPVVMRFRSYDVKLEGACKDYAAAVLEHPAVKGWLVEAEKDGFRAPQYDYKFD